MTTRREVVGQPRPIFGALTARLLRHCIDDYDPFRVLIWLDFLGLHGFFSGSQWLFILPRMVN